jgi:hypothetical protein
MSIWADIWGDIWGDIWAEDAPAVAPTVTTEAVTGIAATSAVGNGTVTDDGGAAITERGVCWGAAADPTTADSTAIAAGGEGAYTVSLAPLTAATTYHVRAYAINGVDTSYGADRTFTTKAGGGGTRARLILH